MAQSVHLELEPGLGHAPLTLTGTVTELKVFLLLNGVNTMKSKDRKHFSITLDMIVPARAVTRNTVNPQKTPMRSISAAPM
jgi:hypothetical protein